MNKRQIEDLTHVSGKRVLVRADYNVPMDANGNITDDTRIRESLSTIVYLIKMEAKIILISHLGKPKGTDKKYSLKPVAARLQELLNNIKVNVKFSTDVIGKDTLSKLKTLKSGEILLLENIRFEAGEEKNDDELSKKLASICDIYVNDAFGAAHRAHASTSGIAKFVKNNAVGRLMSKEIAVLTSVLDDAYLNANRPFAVIMGGAKVSDKIEVIDNLLNKLTKGDSLIIGGAMANTFIKAMGGEVGKSKVENDKLETAEEIMDKAQARGVNLILPVDVKCVLGEYLKNITDDLLKGADVKVMNSVDILPSYAAVDIGPKAIKKFAQVIKTAKVVIWNGPLGVFEVKKLAVGTNKVAKALTKVKGLTIVGGGDSIAAINKLGSGYTKKISHISTGGGASLEFLAGKELPGVSAISDRVTGAE